MPARILIIGLDGADGALLDRWTADGTLPNLAALRARGAATRLSAPAGVTDDALWASFQYAASLGEHGRYHFRQRLDSGDMGMAFRDEADRESFWDVLSKEGLRVAILDVPKCGLPRPLNGIHLVDWLVHGRYFVEPKSYPESLAGEVVARFGPAPPSRCHYEGPPPSDDEVREITANLRTSVARKRAAGLHYLQSETWDLFVIGFKEAHCAGHAFWDLADPQHPGHDSARAASLSNPIRTIFVDLDAAVGDLITAAGPDAAIAVFSTTDMVPNATLGHLMPGIVRRVRRRLGDNLLTRAIRHGVRLCVPTASVMPPCSLLPYSDNCDALRVSPQWGLFRHTPGYELKKAAMLDRIESLLRELADADTGQPAIAAIDRPSATYTGTRAAALPDLLIRYPVGAVPRAVVSPQLGRIESERPQVRPGNHAPGGLLIFAGDTFAGASAMQDLGPLAAKLLHAAIN
jgi:predicted AlkP superfamily phosphohydrolase/phosphomutase